MATWTWPWRRTMLAREPSTGLMGFRPIARRETMCRRYKTPTSVRVPDARKMLSCAPIPSTKKWIRTGELSSPTNNLPLRTFRQPVGLPKVAIRQFEPAMFGESTTGMALQLNLARKNFHKRFVSVSLGFALLGFIALPCFAGEGSGMGSGNSAHAASKREAASTQFAKAESMRSVLNERPPNKKTIVEYTRVATAYRMVYVITPHAMEVPDALLAVGEIYTEMGDRFGRSYYQTSVESYQFLIHEYPTSKLVPDTMLRIAKLQKDQIGDNQAATKSYEQ